MFEACKPFLSVKLFGLGLEDLNETKSRHLDLSLSMEGFIMVYIMVSYSDTFYIGLLNKEISSHRQMIVESNLGNVSFIQFMRAIPVTIQHRAPLWFQEGRGRHDPMAVGVQGSNQSPGTVAEEHGDEASTSGAQGQFGVLPSTNKKRTF